MELDLSCKEEEGAGPEGGTFCPLCQFLYTILETLGLLAMGI